MRKLVTVIVLVLVSVFFVCIFVGCSSNDDNENTGFIFELNKDGQSYSIRANYNARQAEKTLTIPSEYEGKLVTTIAVNGFSECKSLEKVIIPSSITLIRMSAFESCNKLKEISLPDSLKTMEKRAFAECSTLQKVTFGNGLKKVSEQAFYKCEELTEINFSDSITDIEKQAFSGCKSLVDLRLTDKVEYIYDEAFSYCESLVEVKIPASVITLGGWCFAYNNSSDGSYTENLIRVYFYGKAPDGIDQSFGYTWDAEGFAVYVASQYYDEYKNANASNWQRCVVKTGILFKFDPTNKPFTED